MNLEQVEKEINLRRELLKSGKLIGFTSGITALDRIVGRIQPGSIWTIGGYSGSGKSFFALNMIEGMINEAVGHLDDTEYIKPRVCIYSTELSETEYVDRHIHMRLGMFKTQLENYRDKKKIQELEEVTESYLDERLSLPYLPEIVGNIRKVEQIQEHINTLDIPPDVIFIDYVQELLVNHNGRELMLEQDTMPHIAAQLLKLAKDNNSCVIAISQVNNNMANADFATNKQNPFSFGKQLNQASDVSLILTRRRLAGLYSPILECFTVKSRNGDYGSLGLEIQGGFQLKPLTSEEYKLKISRFIEDNAETPTRKKA